MVSDKRQGLRWRTFFIIVTSILLMLAAGIAWLLGTESGARATLSMLSAASSGTVKVANVQGRLAGTLQIGELVVTTPDQKLDLVDLRLVTNLSALLHGSLHLESLHLGQLSARHTPIQEEKKTPQLPASLALPLKLRIDQVQIDKGDISLGLLTLLRLADLAFSLEFDGMHYRLQLHQLMLESAKKDGSVSGRLKGEATLSAERPYAIDAGLFTAAEGQIEQQNFGGQGALVLAGSLAELKASIDLSVNQTQIQGQALLHPFAQQLLENADIQIRGLNLAALNPAMPQTLLNIGLMAQKNGKGQLNIANEAAGPVNQKKLPLVRLGVLFQHEAGNLRLDQLDALLGNHKRPAGKLAGSGNYADGKWRLALRTANLNLQQLDQRLRSTQLSGNADIRHASGRQEISLILAEPLQQNKLTLSARLLLSGQQLEVSGAELRLGDAHAAFSGHLERSGRQGFSAQGRVKHLRPADFAAVSGLPELILNGNFSLAGMRMPELEADLSFELADSRIGKTSLQGGGRAQLRADRLTVTSLSLSAGANRLAVDGELSQRQSRLSFTLSAPELQQLGPGFAGTLDASGTASGSFRRPSVEIEWQAAQLRLPGELRLAQTQGHAQLQIDRDDKFPLRQLTMNANADEIGVGEQKAASLTASLDLSPYPSGPLTIDMRLRGVSFGEAHGDTVSVKAEGRTDAHVVTGAWSDRSQSWSLRAEGGLHELLAQPRWQGHIDTLEARGGINGRLTQAAPLTVSAQRLTLEKAYFDTGIGQIAVETFSRSDEQLASRGRFMRLQLAQLLRLREPSPPVSTDLELSGAWDFSRGETITGTITARRERGDIVMQGRVPIALGLHTLKASTTANRGQLTLQVLAEGAQLGHIEISASSVHNARSIRLGPETQVAGTARIDIPSLAWVAPLVSPGLIAEGRLQSAVSISGQLNNPQLAGQISGEGLRLYFSDTGVDLRQGMLAGRFSQSQLLVDTLRFENGPGHLTVSGPIAFAGSKPELQLALKADRYMLLNRVDRKLTVSGASKIVLAQEQATVSGNLRVDSGFFDIGRQDTPQLSDDVVVIGKNGKQAARFPLALDVQIALGDGVTLRGRGLNALMVGQFRVRNGAGETLNAQGRLRVAKGTFTAYGRELAIERGVLQFDGPVNNPGLNILAMRRGQEVEAGVSVSGTVLAPRIALVSEPSVPDAEKLSWLVLGHGLQSVAERDAAVLQAAASALLGGRDSPGLQAQIASALGLDTLSVSAGQGTLEEHIITLGKQLSSRLYVSYRHGVESATGAVLLRYLLTRRLTLEVEAGARSVLSLFYNIAFD